jgi:tetratricopeptide (TPR) repeat protein
MTVGLGMLEAAMGLDSSLDRAEFAATKPLHEVNAIWIRMLYHLWQGDLQESERCKHEAALRSIEGPGWKTVLSWGQAEYHRIRGDYAAALAQIEAALASMDPLGHPVWPEASGAHINILLALDRCEEASATGSAYVEEAVRRGIGYAQNYIRMPLAIALARLGERDRAFAESDAAIASYLALGSTGLNLGLAYETRARVAWHLGDPSVEQYQGLCAAHYRARSSGPLAAKLERLLRDTRRPNTRSAPPPPWLHDDEASQISALFSHVRDPIERATRALQALLDSSGATEGYLFTIRDGELSLAAKSASEELPEVVFETARRYVAELAEDDTTAVGDRSGATTSELKSDWRAGDSRIYHPLLLSHSTDEGMTITGLALLLSVSGKPYRHPVTVASAVSRTAMDFESGVQRA